MDQISGAGGASQGTTGPKATSIYSGRTDPTKRTDKAQELGREDFMKLLLAQLQHQDPMKPMDDQAFIAQVAQFNTLDQMTALNKSFETMVSTQRLTDASSMIGKVVQALDADGKHVTGTVNAASVEKGAAVLHIGDKKVKIETVSAVAPTTESLPEEDTTNSTGPSTT